MTAAPTPPSTSASAQEEDARLVGRARAGSAQARRELVERDWDVAWSRALALVGRRAVAEDVVQDAFERALRGLEGVEGRSAFRTWLLRIVTNRTLDLLRAERRTVSLGEEAVPAGEWVDASGRRGVMQAAVAGLTEKRRQVVVMRYWLDLSPAEIAAALGVPEGTVSSRLARALASLRQTLEVDDVA